MMRWAYWKMWMWGIIMNTSKKTDDLLELDLINQLANELYQDIPKENPKPVKDIEQKGLNDYSGDLLDPQVITKVINELYKGIPRTFSLPDSRNFSAMEDIVSPLPKSEGAVSQYFSELTSPQRIAFPNTDTPERFYFLPDEDSRASGQTQIPDAFDVGTIRRDFPILHQHVNGKPLIWLDNAATTQKPQSVIDALSRYYQRDNSNVHRGAHTLAARATNALEDARKKVQRFLGADLVEEIIFVRGTTEAINLVAKTYGKQHIGQGDEIVLSTLEHHSNIIPWQMLAQATGATLRPIPINDHGEIIMSEYQKLLNPRTRIVAITHVSNALGTIVPVKELIGIAHHYGVPVLVDGAQAVSHFPVNIQEIDADFYAFSGHKLFAPTGIGVLYGKKKFLENMMPWQGGGNMIEHVTFEKTTYNRLPNKFEAGTGNIADAVGLGAAIDYLNRIGRERIANYEQMLMNYAMESLAPIPGLTLIGTAPEKAGAISFILEGMRPQDVGTLLDKEGIAVRAGHHCAQPALQHFGLESTVRPSLAFYNTTDEIDELVKAIYKIKRMKY
jgi:SufS family cysteine desulfurase